MIEIYIQRVCTGVSTNFANDARGGIADGKRVFVELEHALVPAPHDRHRRRVRSAQYRIH